MADCRSVAILAQAILAQAILAQAILPQAILAQDIFAQATLAQTTRGAARPPTKAWGKISIDAYPDIGG